MRSWANLANLFTLLRLILTPFIVQAILSGQHPRALILFAVAAMTDALDGAAARHLGMATEAGAYFDPIVDKCLLSAVFIGLAAAQMVPWWVAILVIGRDLYILLGAVAIRIATGTKKFPPSVWGKASTFVQIVTVALWVARNAFPVPLLNAAASGIIWICAAATVWSGLHYTWRGIQFTRVD